MKITLFTANQNRHNYLVNLLLNNSDESFVKDKKESIKKGRSVARCPKPRNLINKLIKLQVHNFHCSKLSLIFKKFF